MSGNVWTWWTPDPPVIFLIVGAGGLYFAGLRRWKRRSRPVRRYQVVSFYLGLAALLAALVSPIDPLADRMFSIHQLQHMLLRMVAPALILLGAPLTPLLMGLPYGLRMGLVRPVVSNPLARRAYRWLTHPVLVPLAFVGALYFWQLPAFHNLAVRNFAVHYLMHLSMTASAMLFWWLIIDPKPRRSRLHYGVRVLILGLIAIPNTALGAVTTLSGNVLYEAYGPDRMWSLTPIDDQRIGGLILWLLVDMMNLVAAAVLFSMWWEREQHPPKGRRPASARLPAAAGERS